ncbi:hypothetical protein AGMMS50276_00530 [Synergistales bacterium]|nr:hypothetical protein AGMMS50276_00530 [Synergistales bacterium]
MAGKLCPKCGELTFFESKDGRECTKCGYKMTLPPNDNKGGQGRKCSNCGKMTVFADKCRNCGAKYSG